ncbi:GntR family transcriptional regulator [Pseudomonas cichorii]|uniref:GntR family transcriptional regulator n=1 Tax=Pseudomonas cichorii TaxID=36746 RepID=A0ABQ1DL05_PSECI|nr:GntR family transcriptional regulator [Pseudomonas cichorii]AHF66757.1 regulatory protein, GntR [Pseudomonas cichorii JBC1]QVE18657.1 GntR family transcriptional regulator [Pseudomonas cichorii]GFM91598.1 GntR family transcriptional regulator [Pseudomonas cichorii]SDO04803.1 transcriptional regulator, GntR family [Pseudomonas cichorii]
MTFKASDSLAEQIAQHIAERIIRGELKPGERIQEQKVTQALSVSRGTVREALLILERRHLVVILPRRGAQVTVLDAHNVVGLCSLMAELYILLATSVAERWQRESDLTPFLQIQQRLKASCDRGDVTVFVEESFNVMRAAYAFADNPYLQETVENLQPSMSRSYYLALEQRKAELGDYLQLLSQLLDAVVARNLPEIRVVLTNYCQRSCRLVLAALSTG